MRERPILFSAPMVSAILDDRKTKTRRAVKGIALDWLAPGMFTPEFVADPGNHLCPYGVPGDRLWVRETLKRAPNLWTYAADGALVDWPALLEALEAFVVSLVQRGGNVRSMVAGERVTGKVINKLLDRHVSPDAHLNTDESPLYSKAIERVASHATVNHSKEEYAYYDYRSGRTVTTNTVEGYFGNSKRSIDGTHHQVSRQHLHLYAAELDFKYNTRKVTDGARTTEGIRRMEGKRLIYRAKAAS